MSITFTPPEFVSGNSPQEIQQRMMSNLPGDLDNMPGGFPYDFTMPTALEKSELIQFHLVRTLMLMHPMWAWREWLDYHAKIAGIKRRPAGAASGVVTVTGVPGTQIPSGSVFLTPATDESPSIEFHTQNLCIIGEDGAVNVGVVAAEPGTNANVSAGTITLGLKPIKGVTSIVNQEPVTGGTQEEDDESLRERIQEANESRSASFVGNDSDYIRWAKEVVGVGTVIVVPEWDGPGTVKLVIMDANGQPANDNMLINVYDYIMCPQDRLQRKAPVGASLTVVAPAMVEVSYMAYIVLVEGYELAVVTEAFRTNLLKYYQEAKKEMVLKYTKVAALLSDTVGVSDFTNFLINGDMKNIPLNQDQYPETLAIDFT